MGLDYMRHKETQRHNISDESIRSRQTDIAARESDTHAYVASFKPQEVAISKQQADAGSSQAETAKGRLALDATYRERETAAKEETSHAAWQQSQTAVAKYILDKAYRERETLAKELQAEAAKQQALTAKERQIVDEYLGNLQNLDPLTAAQISAEKLGYTGVEVYLAGANKLLDRLVPNLSALAKLLK
jgi:hypothetical protein